MNGMLLRASRWCRLSSQVTLPSAVSPARVSCSSRVSVLTARASAGTSARWGGKIGRRGTFRAPVADGPGAGHLNRSACRRRHHGHDEEDRREKPARARRRQGNLPGRGQVHPRRGGAGRGRGRAGGPGHRGVARQRRAWRWPDPHGRPVARASQEELDDLVDATEKVRRAGVLLNQVVRTMHVTGQVTPTIEYIAVKVWERSRSSTTRRWRSRARAEGPGGAGDRPGRQPSEEAAGLLRYLFGPGRQHEHANPHLVAAWCGDPAHLEPARHGHLRTPRAPARPDPRGACPGPRRTTNPGGREIGAGATLGQDQVVVGVGQQPVLQPVERRGGTPSRGTPPRSTVILGDVDLRVVHADQPSPPAPAPSGTGPRFGLRVIGQVAGLRQEQGVARLASDRNVQRLLMIGAPNR